MTNPNSFPSYVAEAMVTCPKVHGSDCDFKEIRAIFDNDHIHMALIVDRHGRLVTTIERSDLRKVAADATPVSELGTLVGRTAGPHEEIAVVMTAMRIDERRRLAVVDRSGRLLGLLCLKRDGSGFCSDEGIRNRAIERGRP